LYLSQVHVASARDLKGHLKLDLAFGNRSLSAIAFSQGGRAPEVTGTRRDLIGTLRPSSYTGVELTVSQVL